MAMGNFSYDVCAAFAYYIDIFTLSLLVLNQVMVEHRRSQFFLKNHHYEITHFCIIMFREPIPAVMQSAAIGSI